MLRQERGAVCPSTSSGTAVGGSGTAVGGTVAEPAVAEPVEVSKQGSDPAVLLFLDEPSEQSSSATSSGTAVGGSGTAGDCGVEVLFVYLKWANSLQGSFFIFTFVAIYLDEDLTRKKDVHNHGK